MANSIPPKKADSTTYPDPLVVPATLHHKQTIIILHGRGSNALKFGPPLLSTQLPDGRTLQTAFPHAKFIFPTASKRRAQIYKRSIIHQWFDNWSLSTPPKREELMIDGLRETSQYIHSLLTEAIAEVGASNVVLGGLSQGCAATLISLLTWEGAPLAGVFGFCGWLPLRQHMVDIADPTTLSDGEDPFARDSDAGKERDLPAEAVAWLKEELDLASVSSLLASEAASIPAPALPFQRTPIFLAHGTDDDRVDIRFGEEASACMTMLGAEGVWREYKGLEHWYSGAMLGDLVDFLREKTGWM